MKIKTATIERYHVWGTSHHHLRVTYKGKTLNWWKDGAHVYADMLDYGNESIDACMEHAKRQGFNRVRFVGDWRNPPNGGMLTFAFHLYWMPEGKFIGTVRAVDASHARRQAPMPYRKFKGEIGVEYAYPSPTSQTVRITE